MKRFTTLLAGAAVMMLMALPAFAFTSYPNATCTDSVTLHQLVDLSGACHPTQGASTPGDTVRGIGGIITAFDAVPSSYAIYFQNNRADSVGYLCATDCFTGGTNWSTSPRNLALGDSIVVEFAGSEVFQGSNEVLSPNNNQAAPNVVIRKVSSGNHVPDFKVGTTNLFRTNSTNTASNVYLCSLVRISATMHVARKNVSGTNTFYIVADSDPSDSVFVNGFSLTTYGSPEVGTVVSQVQGIYEHRTSSNYAIWLRSGNDITVETPPNVNDAYSIADNQIRVTFDRDVTSASATNTANYSLASLGSVDAAAMDGTQAVLLNITNGLPHGATESVTANNIVGSANGLQMTSPQSKTFINGVMSIREVSAPNPDSILSDVPPTDRSRFAGVGGQVSQGLAGPRMTCQGVCTGNFGTLSTFEDADAHATGDHGGVSAFGLPITPIVGHSYLIAANVQEFFGETELNFTTYQIDQGAVTVPDAIPVPVVVAARDTVEASNAGGGSGYTPPSAVLSGEDYESMLVKLVNVMRVVKHDIPTKPGSGFHVADAGLVAGTFPDTIFCANLNGVLGGNTAADSLNPNYPSEFSHVDVVGVVHYDNGSFRVCPRNTADITFHYNGVPSGTPKSLSFAVYPNPSSRATISFALPTAQHVEIGVYDVTGRKVATLANENLPAGEFSRGWLGRDDAGNSVRSGMYFYRMKAGNDVRTVRSVLIAN
jgi:hypothetical protein